MVYFFMGAPFRGGNQDSVWNDISRHVLSTGLSTNGKGKLIQAELNRFKLGNLDSLMFINDQLLKQDIAIESLLKKVERQYLDVTEKNSFDFSIESKGQQGPADNFLMDFKWDDQRFPRNTPLTEIIKNLQNRTNIVDNDLRQKIQNYLEVKNQSQQIAKKDGNLLVKDLVDVLKEPIVKPRDFITSENIVTVVAIVPKQQVQEFLACYQLLTENVIPGSAKQFAVDDKDNLTIWRVMIMNKPLEKAIENLEIDENKQNKKQKQLTPLEEFVLRCRDKLKITIRDFEFKPNESRDREKQRVELKSKSDNLTQACEKAFSDLYVTYVHLKFLRVIVDIAMRFGTQDPTLTCIIKPDQGKDKKIQQQLLKLFADPSQMGYNIFKYNDRLYGTKEELEDTEDFFPFVYVTVNIPS